MNAVCLVKLNDSFEVPVENYVGFRLFNSFKEGLPYGYVDLKDIEGTLWSEFNSLALGAKVDIAIVNTSASTTPMLLENGDRIKLPTFYLLNDFNDCAFDPNGFQGTVRIYFGHPWFLFKDVKSHVYKGNISKIIQDILKDKSRGMSFDYDKQDFGKTDDNGKLAKYKFGETDWTFIQDKLLPYAVVNEQPAYFFTTELGRFKLNSLKGLYKQTPKIVLTKNEEDLSHQDIEKLTEKMKTYGLMVGEDNYPYSNPKCWIGNDRSASEIYQFNNLEYVQRDAFVSMYQRPSNNLTTSKRPDSIAGIMPIDKQFVRKSYGTSINTVRHRMFSDGARLIQNNTKNIDCLFNVEVETFFVGNKANLGDTVHLMTNSNHWMDGKWVITEIEHFSEETSSTTLKTRMVMSRSSFIGSVNNTSLLMPGTMIGSE